MALTRIEINLPNHDFVKNTITKNGFRHDDPSPARDGTRHYKISDQSGKTVFGSIAVVESRNKLFVDTQKSGNHKKIQALIDALTKRN